MSKRILKLTGPLARQAACRYVSEAPGGYVVTIAEQARKVKHGAAVRGKKRPGEYNSWAQMRSRCNNPNVPEYSRYGGRGIKVCERWDSYEAFVNDMGPRPHGFSIDRIDVNGDYTPENCRWISHQQQQMNKRTSRFVTINGETKTVTEWIRHFGKNPNTVKVRIHRGWDEIEALTK